VTAQFFALMKFVLDKSSSPVEGQLLTPQLQALLYLSISIRECKNGKEEAISLAYFHLPLEYKYSTENFPSVFENSLSYLNSLIQEWLTVNLSTDNPLMKELTVTPSSKSVPQLSHNAILAKNILGRRLGLAHELEFDFYTETVSTALLKRNLEENLRIAYKYLTVSSLVKFLQDRFRKDWKVDKKVYPKLTAILSGTGSKINFFKIFDLSEDEKTCTLTDLGALEILRCASYLSDFIT
jgi:hypothetical protein